MRATCVKHAEYDILRFMLSQEHPDYANTSITTIFSSLGATLSNEESTFGMLVPVSKAKDKVVQKRVRKALRNVGGIIVNMLTKRYPSLPESTDDNYHFDAGITGTELNQLYRKWLL